MKRTVLWLSVSLLLIPFVLIGYRVLQLGYPVLPSSPVKAWGLTMEVFFEPSVGKNGREIEIRTGLPQNRPGQTIIEQRDQSGSLQLNLLFEGQNLIAIWSGDPESGRTLKYEATILLDPRRARKPEPHGPESFPTAVTDKSEQILARRLIERYLPLSPPKG